MIAAVPRGYPALQMTWLLGKLYRRSVLAWVFLSVSAFVSIVVAWQWFRPIMTSAAMQQCLDPSLHSCSPGLLDTLGSFTRFNRHLGEVLLAVPIFMGAFIGAPLIARELENGTHRLIWTQGITPQLWFMKRAGVGIAFGTLLALLIGLAVAAWLGIASNVSGPWAEFDNYLPVFLAYAVFALALGIAAGTIASRSVPAMAVTLFVWIASRTAFGIFVRPELIPPVIKRGPAASDDWIVGQTYVDSHGRIWSETQVDDLLRQLGGGGPNVDLTLQQHGIFPSLLIQPASRFWTFQGLEAAAFILLSLICVALAFGWVRWRLSRQ